MSLTVSALYRLLPTLNTVWDIKAYGVKIKNGSPREGKGDTNVCSGATTWMHSRLGKNMIVKGVLGFAM